MSFVVPSKGIERANLRSFACLVIGDVLRTTFENPHVIMCEDDPNAKPAVIAVVKRLLSLSAYFQHLANGECPQVQPGWFAPQPSPTNELDTPEDEPKFTAIMRLPSEFICHAGALLLNAESVVFAGLLVSMSSTNFRFALKDNLE
ncbi:hypothetical protein PHET_11423 [Paragonimus heterotremus]|uniref:Uncharacterized protein n=1 Tax=Paragonimus heterotremus TaxID=100268 RepID=A0A8J4T0S8_9TREM|nr:hypothetical protein PHET_11423 [Paragonimus heterotremus]